ncbi:hypothetical protein KIPB_014050, partial [Kipferlia bialata]
GTDHTKEQIAWIVKHLNSGNRLIRPLSDEERQKLSTRVCEDGYVDLDVWIRYNTALGEAVNKYGVGPGEKAVPFEVWWGRVFQGVKEEVLAAFKQVCRDAKISEADSD